MLSLLLASGFFVGIHVGVSGTGVRDRLVARLGEQAYLGLFSVASVVGLVWLGTAYAAAPYVGTWGLLVGLRPVALVVGLLALVFVVLAITTPNPAAMGGEQALEAHESAVGIQRVTRHPFLCGVALWAAAHFVVNGHVKAHLLFGSLLALGVIGPRSIDAKRARRFGARWERHAAVTSRMPFLAIAQGRNRLPRGEIRWGHVAVAAAVYVLLLLVHPLLFGGNPLGSLR